LLLPGLKKIDKPFRKEKKLALTALMRKLIILANRLLKNPSFILAS